MFTCTPIKSDLLTNGELKSSENECGGGEGSRRAPGHPSGFFVGGAGEDILEVMTGSEGHKKMLFEDEPLR